MAGDYPFTERLERLDDALEKLFRDLDMVDVDLLNQTPAPGQWSVGQILSHVSRTEALCLAYVQKKLSFNPQLRKASFNANFRSKLLDWFLRSPIKIQAAKGVRTEDLPPTIVWSDFKDNWKGQRKQLSEYLDRLDHKWMDREVFKHPIVGRISLAQMLDFFYGHFVRHKKQVNRVLMQLKATDSTD